MTVCAGLRSRDMTKIAVTGGMGSGKTTVLECFKKNGAAVASCDLWVCEAYDNNAALRARIRKAFGEQAVKKGRVDRNALAAIVFKNAARVKRLNALVHPVVKRRLFEFFRDHKDRGICVVEVPLLFESRFDRFFDVTIGVATDLRRLRRRLKPGARWSASEVDERMRWQLTAGEKTSRCDFVIDNNGSKRNTLKQVNNIMEDKKWKNL